MIDYGQGQGNVSMAGQEFGTKFCPNCGCELFDDLDVCYECLHEFESPAVADGAACDEEQVPTEAYVIPSRADENPCRPDPFLLAVFSRSMNVRIPLPWDGVVVGRGSECDIVLHDRAVSRRHVRIERRDDGVFACNLGARNAPLLNGLPIVGERKMGVGDRLVVCDTELVLEAGQASRAPASG